MRCGFPLWTFSSNFCQRKDNMGNWFRWKCKIGEKTDRDNYTCVAYLLKHKNCDKDKHLILFLFRSSTTTSLPQVLPLDTTGPATAEGRLEREVNMFLRVQSHNERRNVHHLLAHSAIRNRSTELLDPLEDTISIWYRNAALHQKAKNSLTKHPLSPNMENLDSSRGVKYR